VAVGGWARLQKNARLLVKVIERALAHAPAWRAEIIGAGTGLIEGWLTQIEPSVRERIRVVGPVLNDKLPAVLQRCKVSLCTSYHESFHLATAEALCCGCSFVGDRWISSMEYFESVEGSGTASADLSLSHVAGALLAEVRHWEEGRRDPWAISRTWTGLVHPKPAAERILAQAGTIRRNQIAHQ
jgi:hypothetical protein